MADPGGGANRPRPPPPFFRPIFVFLAYFGRFSGAASRNLDSRPPLFTAPGSVTGSSSSSSSSSRSCSSSSRSSSVVVVVVVVVVAEVVVVV